MYCFLLIMIKPTRCTYLLTPWCRVLLEKLTGLQLVKKFPAFHGTRRLITALTSVRHLPPPISILGQLNPVHIPTSHLLDIHPNIIHPSTPRSPQWSPSLRFPQARPYTPPLLAHTRHMPSPSHSNAVISQIYFWNKTIHVSDSSFVHHQGSIYRFADSL